MACDFCPSKFMQRRKNHMDFGLFKGIIDQIAENNVTKRVNLAALGESLLYPNLTEAVRYCSEKKLETSIVTNSLALTHDLYHRLSDAGLGNMMISFHDLAPESFEYRHPSSKVSYQAFRSNIMGLVDHHLRSNAKNRLEISLMFCKDSWPESWLWDLPAIKESTKNAKRELSLLADELQAISKRNNKKFYLDKKALFRSVKALGIGRGSQHRVADNIYLDFTPLNPQLFNTRKKIGSLEARGMALKKKKKGFCRFLGSPMVLSNGSFIPCCVDGLEELVMGKVTPEVPLMSVINSKGYQDFIDGFKRGLITNRVCGECLARLEHKSPLRRITHYLRNLEPYGFLASVNEGVRNYFWQLCRNRLSKKNRDRLKGCLIKLKIIN